MTAILSDKESLSYVCFRESVPLSVVVLDIFKLVSCIRRPFVRIDSSECLFNDRVDVLVNGLKAQLKASNYTLKDYLSAYGIEDETTLRDQYKSSCESTVKVFLIADAIAADKKISVTDEDVKAYFNGEDTAQYEKQYSK